MPVYGPLADIPQLAFNVRCWLRADIYLGFPYVRGDTERPSWGAPRLASQW
jgi:hypothetical protein